MGEAGQVAAERGDLRATTPAGRRTRPAPDGPDAAYLLRDLGRHHLQVAVDQEEAGERVLAAQPQLRRELRARLLAPGARRRVTLLEPGQAVVGEHLVGRCAPLVGG